MADESLNNEQKLKEAEEEKRFRTRLKEEYGIEEDASTFKESRSRWIKAEEEIPKYQASLQSLIQHFRAVEEEKQQQQVQQAPDRSPEDNEERLRTIAKLDPYEGMKRVLAERDRHWEERLERVRQEGAQVAQGATLQREVLRQSRDQVQEMWPEAFDQNSTLHKMGKQIYQNEMSPQEKADPRSFLIATERAAGRLGLAPKGKRRVSNRSDVSAQSVSRGAGSKTEEEEATEKQLTPRQKHIIENIGVDEKTYREAAKIRRAQKRQKDEDDE